MLRSYCEVGSSRFPGIEADMFGGVGGVLVRCLIALLKAVKGQLMASR